MWQEAEKALFDDLPKQQILAAYLAGRGKEVASGKFANPDSSSALVANSFGAFLTQPEQLKLPFSQQARKVSLEREIRFPWRGGLHPWLDAAVETDDEFVGIESKRFEPFRDRKVLFSEAFQRDVWTAGMEPYRRMLDNLSQGYVHLDAVQLTKHALGLSTQARKQGRKPKLVYLYAEPAAFHNGGRISELSISRHRDEVTRYAQAVAGAEVEFIALTYAELIKFWRSVPDLRGHADRLERHFHLTRSDTEPEAPK